MEYRAEFVWRGPGWYGPFDHQQETEMDGKRVRYITYCKCSDAPENEPFQAGDDAYRYGVGTPDWYDKPEDD